MQCLANVENDFVTDSVRRRVSTPPNICDLEKNERVFTFSDQVLINPLIDENYNNERLESRNEMNNNFAFDVSHSRSMSQPLYQQLTQTLSTYNEMPQTYNLGQSVSPQPPPPYYCCRSGSMH
jgi:hypothetical protein